MFRRYSFVTEASATYKSFLQTLLLKIKEKQSYIDNGIAMINRRKTEITDREKQVVTEVKDQTVKIINEINQRGKKLLSDLSAVCSAKKSQLAQKQREIETLSTKLNHATKFAQFILTNGNITAMMQSKKLLVDQLKHVLRTRCEVPNPHHVVDIRVKYEEKPVLSTLAAHGLLFVDGVPYSSATHTPLQLQNLTQQQKMALAKIQSRIPNLQNLSQEQRNNLLNKIVNMKHSPASSPTVMHSGPRFPVATGSYSSQYLSQAGQSNMVTSSHIPFSRTSPTAASGHAGNAKGSMINLEELQRRRQQQVRMPIQQQQQQKPLQQLLQAFPAGADLGGNQFGTPIVIEPKEDDSPVLPTSTMPANSGKLSQNKGANQRRGCAVIHASAKSGGRRICL